MKYHSVAFTSGYDGSDLPTMNAYAHILFKLNTITK